MTKLFNKKTQAVLMTWLLSGTVMANTQVLTFSENQRLEATIGLEAMNRLAVSNDRIVNLFGDEGTFVMQSDEQSGQVFIKLSPENADKPLNLTLITENGLTQDLKLIPTQTEASTVILKSAKPLVLGSPAEKRLSGFDHSESPVGSWIQALKQGVLGELGEVLEKEHPVQRKHKDFELRYQRSYEAGSLRVQVWQLKNTTAFFQECFEKDFYQQGDKALSLEKRLLEPKEKPFCML